MPVLSVVEVPDQRLRTTCAPVAEVTDDVRRLAADMIETMYAANGIGLAAPQVGVLTRVVVIDLQERAAVDGEPAEVQAEDAEPERVRDPKAYINPELVWVSEELSTYNEGCLSIPDQYAEVTRPARCRVRWLDEQGAEHEADMDGLMSTCMQHEIDHLNGVLFIDHISRLKRDMVMRKLAKARKAG
ncbi:peptide deformylase [uncultured Sphingomonas sp.]|uniref:peptide deformylase n=1 Tax=uncultured Sphingomonas sp. TaxID=158754 RepID=UPI0035CC9D64